MIINGYGRLFRIENFADNVTSHLEELCHGYCLGLHLTDANDVNNAMFV